MIIENISKHIVNKSGIKEKLFENISIEVLDRSVTSLLVPMNSCVSSLFQTLSGIDKNSDSNNSFPDPVYLPAAPSSFPWLNVSENIKFGNGDLDQKKIKELCAIVDLEGYEKHSPQNQSYGFRFRISLARSLALNPKIILLDETFSKMENQTKQEMYQLILDVNKKLGTTFLLATTNISEAVLLSSKIHLMKRDPLEIFKTLSCELDEPEISNRFNSPKYSKCLNAIQELIKAIPEQQQFIISI